MGLGDPRACSLPSALAWTPGAGQPCLAPRGSPGPGGDGETTAWQRPFKLRAGAPSGKGGSGTEGDPASSSHPAPWPGAALPSLFASRWPLPSFLGQRVGSGVFTGLGANLSYAPNWPCDLGRVAPLSGPQFPLPEPACESIT